MMYIIYKRTEKDMLCNQIGREGLREEKRIVYGCKAYLACVVGE